MLFLLLTVAADNDDEIAEETIAGLVVCVVRGVRFVWADKYADLSSVYFPGNVRVFLSD